jgi:riboflavin synthase
MFTGIVQAVATIERLQDADGIRTFDIAFPAGFCKDLAVGASVAIDGVCLTVTDVLPNDRARFDVMVQSLRITTLASFAQGSKVNSERAAKDGAEIGGHPLSGHVDFCAKVLEVRQQEANYCVRIGVPPEWLRYIFAKGYIAINGASLTIADVDKTAGWFEVWLIPETRRMTTFEHKAAGAALNIEIERSTQVMVDTVRAAVEEKLGPLMPALEKLLAQQGVNVETVFPR